VEKETAKKTTAKKTTRKAPAKKQTGQKDGFIRVSFGDDMPYYLL
jgi:hypothetical protein